MPCKLEGPSMFRSQFTRCYETCTIDPESKVAHIEGPPKAKA